MRHIERAISLLHELDVTCQRNKDTQKFAELIVKTEIIEKIKTTIKEAKEFQKRTW